MKPKIAVSLPASTTRMALQMIHTASRLRADLAEIRFDFLKKGESIERITKAKEIPLIATFRSQKCGRAQNVKERERLEILTTAAEAGFEYVDVEIETKNIQDIVGKLHDKGAKTIASYHNHRKTPTDTELREILKKCRLSHATLSKVVTTSNRLRDNLRLLDLTLKGSKQNGLVCFAMGELGIMTRIFSPICGAAFTFASLDEDRRVSPGQISVSRMKRIYREMGFA